MHARNLLMAILLALVGSGTLSAQTPEELSQPALTVGEVELRSHRWGKQTVTFELTNNTPELKFITVVTDVQFKGLYLNPNRRTESHYVLPPMESKILNPPVYIPGNFGRATITVSLYDVVDTLDALLPGQKFFEQPFILTFHVPEALYPYTEDKVHLPPMVERHPDFDNEFARLLPILLNEKKSVAEIAAMAKTDTLFVLDAIKPYKSNAYVQEKDGSYRLMFPFITTEEAEESKKLAQALSDTLAALIAHNFTVSYRPTLDSLISVGAVNRDSNVFYDGGGVAYRPYPLISALVMWFDLGRKFITRTAPLLIYTGSDPCNARIPQFMYAVHGGDAFVGTQFFAYTQKSNSFRIVFGDSIPELECGENFILKARLNLPVSWRVARKFRQETFLLDTLAVQPMIAALGKGADTLLTETYYQLFDLASKYGHRKLLYGHRYWFWNLTATLTIKKLLATGVITRRGSGQYRFDSLPEREQKR